MKIALITTTINVPRVLELYRVYGPDVAIFVAGDKKQPEGIEAFCESINATFLSFADQFRRYPLLSEAVGPNCIQRRNFALLEAVRWGAEIIVSIDDDVFPTDQSYFSDFQSCFVNTTLVPVPPRGYIAPLDTPIALNGLRVSSSYGWFDPGQLLTPTIRHRGIPIEIPSNTPVLSSITNAKIGVAVGLWVGDADVDATHRIANPPAVHSAAQLAHSGVVLDPNTKSVFNAQNICFTRQMAPALFMMPGIGRADDIFASLIAQRVMREHGLHVHYGKPFTACWQNRSSASMIRDLEEEMFTLKHTAAFAQLLDFPIISRKIRAATTVLDQVRAIYEDLQGCVDVPKQSIQAGLAFCSDIEKVL